MTDTPYIKNGTGGAEYSLAKLQTIINDKNANIIPLPFPTGDSDETETFDLLGVIRTITLSGLFTGTAGSIRTTIDNMELLCNGDQATSHELFTDELSASGTAKFVKMASITTTWNYPNPQNVSSYRIVLIEGL